MSLAGEQVLLRAYLQSADRPPHTPTYERLFNAARQHGLAGATVLRGIAGFGSRGMLPSSQWSLVEHVPVIVEIVDSADRITRFLADPIEQIMIGGTVTLERANVMMYRHRRDIAPKPGLRLGDLLEPLSTLPDIQPKGRMTTQSDGVLLRIFIGSDNRSPAGSTNGSTGGQPLHESILQQARQLGLAGATVLRGSEGFGAHSVVHKAALLEMSADLPIVIELVDTRQKIEKLLPWLESAVHEGMITMEQVMILLYREGQASP